MTKQTVISFNLNGLEELRREVGDRYYTKVGILAGEGMHNTVSDKLIGKKMYRKTGPASSLSNVELGVIHELGSETAGIPPRSFLRLPIETKFKEIISAMNGTMVRAALEKRQFRKIFQLLGVKAEELIQDAFSSGGFGLWPDIKQSTKRAKRSSAILIDSAQLRRAVTSEVVSKNAQTE